MLPIYITGVVASLLLNLMVVVICTQKGKRNKHTDLLMLSMAISDLTQSGIGYSIEIHDIMCRHAQKMTSCVAAGFSVTFLALVSIIHLVGFSVERCFVLKFPLKARDFLTNRWASLYIIVPSWAYGLFWASLPLFGISSYTRMESVKKGVCQIDLTRSNSNAMTYAYLLLVFCYVIPIVVIVVSSFVTVREMRRQTNQVSALGVGNDQRACRRKQEMKTAVMAFVLIGTFVFVWTPYATCVLLTATKGHVDGTLFNVSAMVGKSSTLYNPVIYLVFVKDFRQRFVRLIRTMAAVGNGCNTLAGKLRARENVQ